MPQRAAAIRSTLFSCSAAHICQANAWFDLQVAQGFVGGAQAPAQQLLGIAGDDGRCVGGNIVQLKAVLLQVKQQARQVSKVDILVVLVTDDIQAGVFHVQTQGTLSLRVAEVEFKVGAGAPVAQGVTGRQVAS